MTSEEYRKVFARACLVLPCAAPCNVGDVCLVCRERVLSDSVGPCGYRLHSACLAGGPRVQILCGCSECHRFSVYCGKLRHEPVPCAQMMDLCKERLKNCTWRSRIFSLNSTEHVTKLPLVKQWPRGRADDRVTLSVDLETMDLLTTATSRPTLSAAELRQLRNDFVDFFGTKCHQWIRSTEIAVPCLMSWDLLIVDKPADAMPRP